TRANERRIQINLMYTIGYDFGDTFLKLGDLEFAVRLATRENVYAPDPAQLHIETTDDCVTFRAQGLIWAGGQEHAQDALMLDVARGGDGRYIVKARGEHSTEFVKSILILVRGRAVTAMAVTPDDHATLEETPWGKGWIRARRYPFLDAA